MVIMSVVKFSYKVIFTFLIIYIVGCFVGSSTVMAQESGKSIFQANCAACHSIGGGKIVGPDLAGVNERRSEAWLLGFVKSSQTVIKSGDKTATDLYTQFNNIAMPDQALSDDQIKAVLAHIKSTGSSAVATPTKNEVYEPTQEEIALGQSLFQGTVRFAKGGPSCMSCHNVQAGDVLSGGILAKDLTMAYSRLGVAGIRAIISSPPFPVMKSAYEGRSFEDNEIKALVGFLYHTDYENTLHQPREYGWAMLGAGIGGVFFLLGLYSVLGRRRKRQSVNQVIYDRQIKSE